MTPYELVSAQTGGGGCLFSPLGETRADGEGRFEISIPAPYDANAVSLRVGKRWLHWEPYQRTDQAREGEGGLDSTGSLEVRVRVLGCDDAVMEVFGEHGQLADAGVLSLGELPDDRPFTVRTACREDDGFSTHRQLHRPGDDPTKTVRFARALPLALEIRDPSGTVIPELILIIDAQSSDSSTMRRWVRQTDLNGRASLMLRENLTRLRIGSPRRDVLARREWAGESILRLVHPSVAETPSGR